MKRSKFEQPRRQVDVSAVLEALGVTVTKREGRSLHALCPSPDHDDSNPSWSIVDNPSSARNGYHYCFSCQFGGGIISLVRAVKGMSIDEAVAWLGDSPKHEPALEVDVVVAPYRAPVRGMRVPHEVKVRPFDEWPTSARRYLEARSITAEQVERFDIGYALEGRLAGRIIFPMKDASGAVVSYTARDFTGQGKRYLEPQTSEGAIKGALFGEHRWRGGSTLFIAEGCPDALALDRLIRARNETFTSSVCALHGSRLHPNQAVKFSRFSRLIVATDNDPAGEAVADEIAEALGRYCQVIRARPPEGDDCASLTEHELSHLIDVAMGIDG